MSDVDLHRWGMREPRRELGPAGLGPGVVEIPILAADGTPDFRPAAALALDAMRRGARDNADMRDPDLDLVAGTAWLFAREEMEAAVDVLVVDEAGQVSLADALAMGTSARTLILLGDPTQLAQVSQGVHPEGMHPDVCGFVSRAFYGGRLSPVEEALRRTTPAGTGLRFAEVPHVGNTTWSQEEADQLGRGGRAPRPRVPALAHPAQRGGLAGQVPRLRGGLAGAPRDRCPDDRADAPGGCPLPIRRGGEGEEATAYAGRR